MQQEKKVRFWWLMWLPNQIRYICWPLLRFAWSEFAAVRILACLAIGCLGPWAVRLAWNRLWPLQPIGTLASLIILTGTIGAVAVLTRTRAGNDILGTLSGIAIVIGCLVWLAVGAVPALLLLLGKQGKRASQVYFGPLEWADRKFFLARRAGD